jgi:integrase
MPPKKGLHCGMKRNTTTSALEWNQMLGLCDQLKKDGHYREYLLFLLGCHFGLRISDLISLTWRDVLRQETVFLKEGKTGKQRVINVHVRVQEALVHCVPLIGKGSNWSVDVPIFANRWGNQISVSYVNKRIKWVLVRYRIKTQNASSHTLRKTFGRRLWEQHGESDKALVFLSEIFGHSNTAITRRYLGITQEKIANAYLSL